MEDLYSIHPGILRGMPSHQIEDQHQKNTAIHSSGVGCSDLMDILKAQIASHPRYPALISAYIECKKVGAPPEISCLLEEIGREKHSCQSSATSGFGVDPELDDFMESYCKLLVRYKEELSKSFDEAAAFIHDIEMQLKNLCIVSSSTISTTSSTAVTAGNSVSDEAAGSSEEDASCGEAETSEGQESGQRLADNEIKNMLLKKYSGYLSCLKKEFLKKRKKGKLPKDARLTLLEWWNTHYRWPYPTEEEKAKLAEKTGLDQKQINNWFINQRKRHWKPSEDMRFAFMDGVNVGSSGTMLYFDTGTIGP